MRSFIRMAGARFFPRRRYRPKSANRDTPPGLLEILNQPDPPLEWIEELAEPDSLVRHCLNAGCVERIVERIHKIRPDAVVLCDTSMGLLAPYVRGLGVPVIVGPHNLDSALYESMAQRASTPGSRQWNSLAARAFRAAEEIFAPCVDQLWVCSEEDARRFGESLVDPKKIHVVPNVFDVEAPSPMAPDSRDLVFVGQANYYPNEDAIRNLFRISKTLDDRGVAHRMRIVGRAGDQVKADAKAFPSVEMLGYVAAVAPIVDYSMETSRSAHPMAMALNFSHPFRIVIGPGGREDG